jgi:hypothetical protein
MIRRIGRPGIAGTMARTAVIAGTATAVSGGMMRHAQQKEMQKAEAQAYEQQQQQEAMQAEVQAQVAAQMAAQQAAAPPPPPPPAAAPAGGGDDMIAKLTQLADLKAQGILSDAEFDAAKAKLLAG